MPAVGTGAILLPLSAADPAAAAPAPLDHHDRESPFALGVASGDPLPDGVILWTRLLRAGGPLPARPVDVEWQVALDERFRRVVRSGHAVARPELGHSVPGDFGLIGAGTANTTGTLTGEDQERWLREGLDRSPARWNVIAQQVMMSRTKLPNPTGGVPPLLANLDQWDGYAPQRTRLLQYLADAQVANPVVLAGDIHSSWFSELKLDFDRPEQSSVAVEFTATSVGSDFPAAFDAPLKAVNPLLNPHVRYFDGSRRGYLRCEVGQDLWRTDARTVDTIATRTAPVATSASYVVETGTSTLSTS